MGQIRLETRLVGDIKGRFFLPAYQRGYRWGLEEVRLLLDDIFANASRAYCLQPVVVKNLGDRYELIDGQQRLTTIYLIYAYLHRTSGGFLPGAKFSLEYDTREKSAEFLKNIDPQMADDNIDFFFISQAYGFIEEYFEEKGDKKQSFLTDINKFFDQTVSVIWYEVPDDASGIDLFERLNIGKIPLTSSELVKALFLREDAAGEMSGRQEEIALQWDNMERDLSDTSVWAFLTNAKAEDYPTRIDLLLDLMADKKRDTREKYHTFFYFDKEITRRRLEGQSKALDTTWKDIYHTFLTLKEWHNDHDFYHKIGYLISSGFMSLRDVYELWKDGDTPRRKDEFTAEVDNAIRRSIASCADLGSLRYGPAKDNAAIERLLLLMNVETERKMDAGRRRFPFDKHKEGDWSLEHIHARHSEGLATNEKRRVWLRDHAESLRNLASPEGNELATLLDNLAENIERNPEIRQVKEQFEPLRERTVKMLSDPSDNNNDDEDYPHRLGNMALIDRRDNTALSNYVFDAKRDKIINLDRDGRYIPVCTKMVFFKYYSSGDTHLHFWGDKDRISYFGAIKEILADYLPAPTEGITDNNADDATA